MRLEDLNWFDVESYLKQDNRLMLILGACEQHGYLSLLSDTRIPLALADAASQHTGVLVSPPLNFGSSAYFLDYPGTLSLRISTLLNLTEDLVNSAYQQGFRRFLFLNGHGGNDPAGALLSELANKLPDTRFAWYAWWESHAVEAIAMKHGLKSYHAGWIEAFPFTRVSDLPEGEKIPVLMHGVTNSKQFRQDIGDGVFGGPYHVDESISQEIFQAALEDVIALLRFE